jgi:hypothetical protein
VHEVAREVSWMDRASPIAHSGAQRPIVERAPARRGWERVLSPVERLSEILFGLIMSVSITGSLSVAGAGQDDVRQMLAAALGCNTAWGIVDALMYVMTRLIERSRGRALLSAIRREPNAERAHRVIADALPPLLAARLRTRDLEHLRRQLVGMEELPQAGLTQPDLTGAAGVLLLVFLSTVPVAVPFLLPVAPRLALRISHGVALVLLFAVGCRLGRYVSVRPLAMGAAIAGLGATLVGIVMALGG